LFDNQKYIIMKKFLCYLLGFLLFGLTNLNAQLPCTLSGGSVYIDQAIASDTLNATVAGTSTYHYSWIDTNGVVISTSSQTSFYTQWCVTIEDVVTGCDTTICQDCIASTAVCVCPMFYMPVCGCDGVMYSNYCEADCADVSWTPAISNGMPGGFLPCPQPSICDVEIIGDSIICSWVSPQVLEAVPTGSGTAPYTYLWDNGQSNSSILTITTSGNYCVTITDANGCVATECINVSVQDITIYSAPSPPIICLGDSIVLEIDTIGLSNIIWLPNGTINTTNRVVDYPISSTTYVVEAVDSSGCDRRGEILVTIDSCNTSPCIVDINNGTVDIEICDGDTAILEATTGFDTYLWTEASAGIPLGSAHIINVIDPGLYIVIATDIQNNCVDMDSIQVIVYQSPPLFIESNPDPPEICLGDQIVLEGSTGFTYYWWDNGSTGNILIDAPTEDTWYLLSAKDSNDCVVKEDIWVYVDSCISALNEELLSKINIYPNPAAEEFFINLNSLNFYNMEIIDIIGRVIISKENVSDLIAIKTTGFSEGTYFIKLQTYLDIQIYKIIIDK